MQEFTAVTAPNASGLADALNQHASDGWSLVQVVNAGHELAAILSRDAAPAVEVVDIVADDTPVAETPVAETVADVAPTLGLGALAATQAADEPAGWASAPEEAVTNTEAAAETAISPTLPGTQPAAAAPAQPEPAAPAVPSGWYADPSGRFELRYWDGAQWTEHVSRAGQQYTDPPVA